MPPKNSGNTGRKAAPKKTATKAPNKKEPAEAQAYAPASSPLPALLSDDPSGSPIAPPIVDQKTKRMAPPPRSPLPGHSKRVKNPGAPDMKRAKRTPAEVEADKAEVDALKAQIVQLQQERLQSVAKMELAQEAAAKALVESTVMSKPLPKKNMPLVGASFGRREQQSELDGYDSDTPILEFDDEDFDAQEEANERIRRALKLDKAERAKVADRYNLDKLPPLAPLLKAVKRKKGDARAAVDETKEMLTRKREAEPYLEVDKPAKKAKSAFPSGIDKNWRDRVDIAHRGTTQKKVTKAQHQTASIPIGGLADNDMDAARPEDSRRGGGNNVVEIISDDESDGTPIHAPTRAGKPSKPQIIVKAEVKSYPKKFKFESSPLVVDSEVIGLPEFARNGWVTCFLPTWYHYIGTRGINGWDVSLLGEEVVAIQQVLDLAYVGTTYQVKKGCPIYTTAMARLGDKRHLIGASTKKMVQAFFESPEYVGKPEKIARYAMWALQDTGPGWYEVPLARGVQYSAENIPTGLFRSHFCLVPLTAFVKTTSRSKGDFGNRFVTAAAMICAGLERGFNQFVTGVMVPNGDFSKGRVGEYAKAFTKIALQVEDFRWTKIARCCIAQMQADGDGGHLLSASASMNVNRGAMALGSSPVKEDSDFY
ncbi:hypothetical protein B0H14DRAFT_3490504 [Mycena olivaceomarginata]|nr:hypothetical protein B0H14DRAFT_3490504 [Mycena olivaceomarginata]